MKHFTRAAIAALLIVATPLAAYADKVTPIARGGTGSATQNFVDLSSTQAAIGGVKTFTSNLIVNGGKLMVGSATDNSLGNLQVTGDAVANGTLVLNTGTGLGRTAAYNATIPAIYGGSSGGSYPFNTNGHLVLEPRVSGVAQSVVILGTAGASVLVANAGGNVSIGKAGTGTARLELPAGTATANTAPLKLNSGTNLTTPEAGAFEFNGTDLFFTPAATRLTAAFRNIAQTFTGDQTISTGDLIMSTAGKGVKLKEGSNARMGTATLVGGTVTVSNTSVTANTRIYLTKAVGGGTRGLLEVGTVTPSTSFVINSVDSAGALAADTSTVNWLLIEPSP